jgi:hypothetical protein
MSKELLTNNVKSWIKLDNEIKQLQSEIAFRKQEKKKVNIQLMDNMKSQDIDCLDLKDGQLCYTKKNIKKPISKKILLDILTKYYNDDISKATYLNEFIMENRIEVTKENITRKFIKP